jgi:hypothetical protein
MTTNKKIFFFFVLPIIAPLIFPPDWLQSFVGSAGSIISLLAMVAMFMGLGYLLLTGSSTALTLSIFLQGLNVIIRLMMLFPRATYSDGTFNPGYILASLISIALSAYLLLRLDRVDVRTLMVK